jgi:hypothetical protein
MVGGRGARLMWAKVGFERYKLNKVDIVINADGTLVTGNIQVTDIPMVVSLPSLTRDQIKEQLTDIRQATGLPIQFSEQSIKDPPNNPDGSVPPNQQTYYYFSFSISSPYSPREWKVFFDKFSGLEFLKITFNPAIGAGNKWTYEGRIYAK